jgi:hypothetical protein
VKGRKLANEKGQEKRLRSRSKRMRMKRRRLRLACTIIPLLVLQIIVEFLI